MAGELRSWYWHFWGVDETVIGEQWQLSLKLGYQRSRLINDDNVKEMAVIRSKSYLDNICYISHGPNPLQYYQNHIARYLINPSVRSTISHGQAQLAIY